MTGRAKIAITFTGGLDSTVLLYEFAKWYDHFDIHVLACNYGQATWSITKKLLRKHMDHLGERAPGRNVSLTAQTLTVKLPQKTKDTPLGQVGYIPTEVVHQVHTYQDGEQSYANELLDGRNAFLFLHMLAYCSARNIPVLYSGHQYEPSEWENLDSYRHRQEDFGVGFIDRMNLLQEVGFKNRVRIEAPFMSRRWSKKQIVENALRLSINVKKDTYSCQYAPECGKCDNCVCRKRTFEELGIK